MPDVEVSTLHVGEELGDGGQGRVHALTDRPGEVLKRYHNHQAQGFRPDLLNKLITLGATLSIKGQPVGQLTAWPTARATESGKVVGFLMPRIPPSYMIHIAGRDRLADLSYLAKKPPPMWGDVSLPALPERARILTALTDLLIAFHAANLVLGDISFGNILWRADPAGVFLIDCDGVFLEGQDSVLPQADTLDWDDPKAALGAPPDRDRDRYKLALAVLRVLARQLNAVPTPSGHYEFGLSGSAESAVQGLLRRSAGEPGERPTAEEWKAALSGRGHVPVSRPSPRPLNGGPAAKPELLAGHPGPRQHRPVSPRSSGAA